MDCFVIYCLGIEESFDCIKLNSPCRVSWKIFNYTSKRLELLVSPVCNPNVVFQGAIQKHLLLNHGASEVMKGFIFVKEATDSVVSMPTLLLRDHAGAEIMCISNPSPMLRIATD